MGKHRAHRPWWKPGEDGGSWKPNAEPAPEPEPTPVVPVPPEEVVLVPWTENGTTTVRAVYRRHLT